MLGALGEGYAVRYLSQNGYDIIHRNFRRADCEIDIVAVLDNVLIFIEVKTRTGNSHGSGADYVAGKQESMRKAAMHYISEYGGRNTKYDLHSMQCRFDVFEVYGKTFCGIFHPTHARHLRAVL